MTTTSTLRTPAPAVPSTEAHVLLRPLGLDGAQITGGLWLARQGANRDVSIPDGLRQLGDAKNLQNFEIAAGRKQGEAVGPIFADSDVYKWLEAAAWEYARSPDDRLLAQQLEITELIAAAQAEDGYLDTVVQIREGERYRDPARNHEHYCAGHLFQAAVAQLRCTGQHRTGLSRCCGASTEQLYCAIASSSHRARSTAPSPPAILRRRPLTSYCARSASCAAAKLWHGGVIVEHTMAAARMLLAEVDEATVDEVRGRIAR